jgi:hypothetical protein
MVATPHDEEDSYREEELGTREGDAHEEDCGGCASGAVVGRGQRAALVVLVGVALEHAGVVSWETASAASAHGPSILRASAQQDYLVPECSARLSSTRVLPSRVQSEMVKHSFTTH